MRALYHQTTHFLTYISLQTSICSILEKKTRIYTLISFILAARKHVEYLLVESFCGSSEVNHDLAASAQVSGCITRTHENRTLKGVKIIMRAWGIVWCQMDQCSHEDRDKVYMHARVQYIWEKK